MPLRRSAKIQTFQSAAAGIVPRGRRVILNRSASDSTQRG